MKTLDKDYDDTLEYLADSQEIAIRSGAAKFGMERAKKGFESLLERIANDDLVRKAGVKVNQSFSGSFDPMISMIRSYIMQFGELAKQSVLNNSTLPYAEESKKDFPDSTQADAEPMDNSALPKDLKE